MKISLTCLLMLGLALFACRKSQTPAPDAPSPVNIPPVVVTPVMEGTLTGTVIPAAGVTTVEIIGGGTTRTATIDDKTGGFSLMLPAGDYSIKVQAAPGFVAPAVSAVKVDIGKTAIAGDLALYPEGTTKAFYLYVSGILRKGTLTAKYAEAKLNLNNVETIKQNTGTPEAKIDQYTLTLELPKLNGSGSFMCNSTTGATVRYERAVPATGGFPLSGRVWLAWEGTDTDTRITITQVDEANRIISGYFSGNLASTIAGQLASPTQCIFRIPY